MRTTAPTSTAAARRGRPAGRPGRLGRDDQRHARHLGRSVDVHAEQHADLVDELVERGPGAGGGPAAAARSAPARVGRDAARDAASSRRPRRRAGRPRGSSGSRAGVVLPPSCQIGGSSRLRRRRVSSSTAPNGSSSSSSRGDVTRQRAMAARWRMPPDSWAGLARSNPWSPTRSMSSWTRAGSGVAPRQLAGERDVRRHRAPRQQRGVLEGDGDLAVAPQLAGSSPSIDDRAGGRRLEPGDDPQQRRLPAARRADERGHRARAAASGRRRRGRATARRAAAERPC